MTRETTKTVLAAEADRNPVYAAAAEWRLRLRDPNVTREDILAWQTWIRADQQHADAFRRLEALSEYLRSVPRPALPSLAELARDTYDASVPIRGWQRGVSPLRLVALAASVLIGTLGLALLATRWVATSREQIPSSAMATRVGEIRSIRLADGSTVMLGGDSKIAVTFSTRERHIDLLQGEAFFTVAKDRHRPLKVAAGRAIIVAVGTEFNVHRGADRVVVDVVEGRVIVEPRSIVVPVALLRTFRPKLVPVSVGAGEETSVDSSEIEPAAPIVDVGEATSWTSGRLAFRMQPLGRVLEDVNRYASKPIVIEDPDIGDLKVTGTIVGGNVSGWVASLGSALGIVADEEPSRVILRRAR